MTTPTADPSAAAVPPDDQLSAESPEVTKSRLQGFVDTETRRACGIVLSAIQYRDCTKESVYALVRSTVLDAINGVSREIKRELGRHDILPVNGTQFVFDINDSQGLVVGSRADMPE